MSNRSDDDNEAIGELKKFQQERGRQYRCNVCNQNPVDTEGEHCIPCMDRTAREKETARGSQIPKTFSVRLSVAKANLANFRLLGMQWTDKDATTGFKLIQADNPTQAMQKMLSTASDFFNDINEITIFAIP